MFAGVSVFPGEARANQRAAESPGARDALLAYLNAKGVDLRAAEHKSNAISHMYSVGPEHEKQYLVGLTYDPRAVNAAAFTRDAFQAYPAGAQPPTK